MSLDLDTPSNAPERPEPQNLKPVRKEHNDRNGENMSKLSVNIGEELYDQLQDHCALRKLALGEEVTKTDVVREALSSYLDGFADELTKLVQARFGDG